MDQARGKGRQDPLFSEYLLAERAYKKKRGKWQKALEAMRQAAAEAQSLQDKLAKAIAAAADLEQLVEARQQEMQEAQQTIEDAHNSLKSSLGIQVDQSTKTRK